MPWDHEPNLNMSSDMDFPLQPLSKHSSKPTSKFLSQPSLEPLSQLERRPSEEVKPVFKEDLEPSKPSMRSLIQVLSYGTPVDYTLQIIGAIAAIGAGTALPFMTLVFGKLVDIFNTIGPSGPADPEEFRRVIALNTLWFVYLFLGKFVLVYVHTLCFTITGTRVLRTVRLKYLSSFLRQDISYYDSRATGSVTSRITANANNIHLGISDKLGSAIQAISMFFATFILAFIVQWKLTLVSAVTFPGMMLAMGFTVSFQSKIEARLLTIYSRCGSLAEEVLGSIRTVISLGASEKLCAKYDQLLAEAMKQGFKKGPIIGIQFSIQWFAMYCGYSLSFWYGIRLYSSGEIQSPGTIITVFFAVLLATTALTQIGPNFEAFANAAAAAADFLDIATREPPIDSQSLEGSILQIQRGRISFVDVDFRYPARPDLQVLSDFSLDIPEKKVTAIVGPSGAGKSTIFGLLERWYDPTAGSIYFDETELRHINIKTLRASIGLVQQEPNLFNSSIFENVCHGLIGTEHENKSEGARLEMVREACIKANAHEFIRKLPDAYSTKVGSGGCLLSGGQKQRIAIARSIIANPPILLLDEATSALDSRSESLVQAALEEVSKDRTTIVIAHRLSTVTKADNIVVMEDGCIVEQGTHNILLAANGPYSRLVQAQSLVSDSDNGTDPSAEEFNAISDELKAGDRDSKDTADNYKQPTTPQNRPKRLSFARCVSTIVKEQKQHWPIFMLGLAGCVLGGAAFPVQAILFARIVSVFQLPLPELVSQGNFWALMFFILAWATLLSYAVLGYFMTRLSSVVSRFYRLEYLRAMAYQDVVYFDENPSQAVASNLSTYPANLQELIGSKLGLVIVVFVDLIGSSILSLVVGWKLALVGLFAALPLIFAAGYVRLLLDRALASSVAKTFRESTAFAAEAVAVIRTVASLTMESKIYDDYRGRLNNAFVSTIRRSFIIMIYFALSESIDLLAMALTFWYGGQLMSTGEYSTNQFFSVFVAVIFGGQAAGFLFGYSTNFNEAHEAANNILQLRQQVPIINGSQGMLPRQGNVAVAVDIKDAKFSYPLRPSEQVLRGLNLRIMRGQSVALVGPSGCGKTTVLSLLERFYDVTSGEILVHGQPISSMDVAAHRRQISLVSQEPSLYQGSIRDNILLGANGRVSEERLIQACKDSNIHDFINSLPEGYDTDCGARGVALSGGQRQRLAIARALIRNPEILLLDEATSALDTHSEVAVQEAVQKASRGRTVITVAHRLSTVQSADVIFVLDRGIVVERGTHSELLALQGRYFAMCQLQRLHGR